MIGHGFDGTAVVIDIGVEIDVKLVAITVPVYRLAADAVGFAQGVSVLYEGGCHALGIIHHRRDSGWQGAIGFAGASGSVIRGGAGWFLPPPGVALSAAETSPRWTIRKRRSVIPLCSRPAGLF